MKVIPGVFMLLKKSQNFRLRDIAALAGANVAALLIANLVTDESFAPYVFVLAAYHLFLGWLVLSADKECSIEIPAVQACLYHLGFFCVLTLLAVSHDSIPFFQFVQYAFAALALMERTMLFRGEAKKAVPVEEPAVIAEHPRTTVQWDSTPEDEKAWYHHLDQQRGRAIRRRHPIAEEYKQFIAARVRARAAAEAASAIPPASASARPSSLRMEA